MSKTHYHIDTGCGGMFNFPFTRNGNETFNIATSGLVTCVGVYVPLSDNKCFAAHVFARVSDLDPDDERIGEERMWVPQDDEGSMLVEKVIAMLERQVRPHMPAVRDLQSMRENAVVVCPGMTREDDDEGKQHAAVGSYVVQGLRQFLGGDFEVNEVGGGFSVNHQTGEQTILEHNDIFGWQRFNPWEHEEEQAKDWWLEFVEGEWR